MSKVGIKTPGNKLLKQLAAKKSNVDQLDNEIGLNHHHKSKYPRLCPLVQADTEIWREWCGQQQHTFGDALIILGDVEFILGDVEHILGHVELILIKVRWLKLQLILQQLSQIN